MENRKAIKKTTEILQRNGIESAAFEATQIVEFAVGNAENVTETDWQKIKEMTAKRLENEPLQYILGEWEFYGLPIKVGEGVLVPRPDTETVVDEALKLLKSIPSPTVFDLCAGSGCIGIALAHYGKAKVSFFEKSPEALHYLKQNTELNSVECEIRAYDVLGAPPKGTAVDMIVSNPPYIRTDVIGGLSAEVQKEPKMALDGGSDGLVFYRYITKVWKSSLKNGGWLVFELGYDQAKQVTEILKSEGFGSVECKKDLGGNPRVVLGQYII